MTNSIVLSIVIATYNRSNFLQELLEKLLTSTATNDKRWNIVICDNCSTDDTIQMIEKLNSHLITVKRNDCTIPAFSNMIKAIFLSDGKYALYCNDRDFIYPEHLTSLIDFLESNDYSFVTTSIKGRMSQKLKTYNTTEEKIHSAVFCHHPTGLIFNSEIAKQKLNMHDYFLQKDMLYTWDLLAWDLMNYGPCANSNLRIWSERTQDFLLENKSGSVIKSNVYFLLETKYKVFCKVLEYILSSDFYYTMNNNLQKETYERLLSFFANSTVEYKFSMGNKFICGHYNISPRFITTKEFCSLRKDFIKREIQFFKDNDIKVKEQSDLAIFLKSVQMSLFIDIKLLIHKIIPKELKNLILKHK